MFYKSFYKIFYKVLYTVFYKSFPTIFYKILVNEIRVKSPPKKVHREVYKTFVPDLEDEELDERIENHRKPNKICFSKS